MSKPQFQQPGTKKIKRAKTVESQDFTDLIRMHGVTPKNRKQRREWARKK